MANPTVSLNATALAGSYRIEATFNADFLTLQQSHKIVRLTVISNETGSASDSIFKTVDFPAYEPSGDLITSVVISEEVLPLGKKTYVFARYVFANGTIVNSNILVLINRDIPSTPVLVATGLEQNIRNEDEGFSINPSLMNYQLETVSDGYTPITEMIVYVSKVETTSSTSISSSDFKIYTVTLELDSNNKPIYNKWYLVTSELTNATLYEVSLIARNITGITNLSNTVHITPSDVPTEMIAPKAFALLADQRRKNVAENDTRGDTVLYLQRPGDFENLITSNKKVTKFVIYEQQVDLSGSVTVEVGASVSITINLSYDGSNNVLSSGQFSVLSAAEAAQPIDGKFYHYRYTITGTSQRLGKQFRYKVLASNENGDSPISPSSSSVWSFIKPALQEFTLEHNNTTSIASGAALVLYDGKMSMKITSLSAINGGQDLLTLKSGVGSAKINDVELKLVIKTVDTNVTVFNELVKFIQRVTQDPSNSSIWRATGEYTYSFDSATTSSPLNTILELGTKYAFSLVRVSKDPANTDENYESTTYDIFRTKFASPQKVQYIECYAVNDNLTPTSELSNTNLRLIFEQLDDNEFNGMQAFKLEPSANTIYNAFRNSQQVPGLAGVSHDYSNVNKTKEILVPSGTTSFGSLTLYARGTTYNPELQIYIDHNESSPQVTESTFGKPGAVTNMSIQVTSTSATITYTKQDFNSRRGSSEDKIQNRLILFKDGEAAPVSYDQIIPATQANPSFTVTGLTTGATYSAFIVAERLYTRDRHIPLGNGVSKRFNNTIIVGDFATANFIPIGTPSKPENVELFASDKKVTAYFDQPLDLGGILHSNIRYHFYLNRISDGLLNNVSVVDTNNDTEIVLDKAFDTSGGAVNRSNLVALFNTINYYFNMRVIGTIGGNGVINTNRNLSDPFGTYAAILTNVGFVVGQAEVYVNYSLTASNTVATKEIIGVGLTNNLSIIPNEGVTRPQDVVVNPQDGKLVVTLNKDTTADDLIITIDYNDATNDGVPIEAFDTRGLRSASTGAGGLISLDNFVSNNSVNIPDDVKIAKADVLTKYATDSFTFTKIPGITEKYSVTIPNLINGKLYNISVRYCKFSGINDFFSEEVTVVRAPEAPPTVVTSASFTVDNEKISIDWGVPSNTGGAGVVNSGNSDIKYRVLLYSVNGSVNTLDQQQNTTTRSFIFTGLTNGSSYRILVAGYYTKPDLSEVIGPYTDINSKTPVEPQNVSTATAIRPNAAPTGLTFTPGTSLNNQITGTITLPNSTQLSMYPLTRLEVIIRHKNDTTKSFVVQQITTNLTTGNGTIVITPITDTTSSTAFVHAKPLNGFDYDVIIKSVPNYTYAQAPPDVVTTIRPYGQLSITSIAQQGLASAKTFRVVANVNGTGSVSNIVAVGKGTNSNLFGVLSLSTAGSNLPTIAISGTLDNTTNFVASNQIVTFDLNLSSVLSTVTTVSDALVVVSTSLGSDALAFPTTGSFFV